MTMSNFVANLFSSTPTVQNASAAPARRSDAQQQPTVKGSNLGGQNGATISQTLFSDTVGQAPASKFAGMINDISQQPVSNFEGMSFFEMMKNPPADASGFENI